jgi:hypothetical protein
MSKNSYENCVCVLIVFTKIFPMFKSAVINSIWLGMEIPKKTRNKAENLQEYLYICYVTKSDVFFQC